MISIMVKLMKLQSTPLNWVISSRNEIIPIELRPLQFNFCITEEFKYDAGGRFIIHYSLFIYIVMKVKYEYFPEL